MLVHTQIHTKGLIVVIPSAQVNALYINSREHWHETLSHKHDHDMTYDQLDFNLQAIITLRKCILISNSLSSMY